MMSLTDRATAARQDSSVRWMSAHGHPGYAREICDLQDHMWEIIGEAGRNWQFCEFTVAQVEKTVREMEEVAMAAEDRIRDWASD